MIGHSDGGTHIFKKVKSFADTYEWEVSGGAISLIIAQKLSALDVTAYFVCDAAHPGWWNSVMDIYDWKYLLKYKSDKNDWYLILIRIVCSVID